MAKQKKASAATVVMPPKSHRGSKLTLLVLSGFFILVIIAAVMYGLYDKGDDGSKTPKAPPLSKSDQAQNLRLSGDTSKATQSAQDSLKDSSLSDSEKSDLYAQLGAAYSDQKKYQAALDAYDKSAALVPMSGTYELEADIAVQMGDSQKAIDYYQNAIKHLSSDSPRYNADKEYYQQKIDALGAKQ